MKKKICILIAAMLIIVMTSAFVKQDQYIFKANPNAKWEDVNSTLIRSMNKLGLQILKQEVSTNKNQDILISPISIFTTLNLTALGAAGDTGTQMKKVMMVDKIPEADRNDGMNTMINYIRNTSQNSKSGSTEIYNSLWINKGIGIKKDFIKNARVFYDADVFNKDFSKSTTIKDMNSWVNDKSKGLIKNPIQQLSNDAVLNIFNVVHFLGKWKEPFDVNMTKQELFTQTNGKVSQVQMMNDTRYTNYYEDEDVKVGILNFDNGDIVIMLPEKDINSFVNKLSIADIDKYTSGAKLTMTQLKLPKLNLNYKTVLNNSMIKLGMKLPFDSSKANFDNLKTTKTRFYIDKILHQCVLKLDEEKAEAAAFTGVMMNTTAVLNEQQIKQLYINKPFVFMIRNDDNILFIGKVEKP